jgi:dolichyl-phosphate beta-glucosyltransferase
VGTNLPAIPCIEGRVARHPDLSIIIPAFNEGSRIALTIREIVGYCTATQRSYELIVVDDGSSDDTSSVAQQFAEAVAEIRLVRLEANHGKGYAVRAGVLQALGASILFADADGATPISEIERLELALARDADIAIGSRARRVNGVRVEAKLHRHLIGRTFHRLVEWLANAGVADTQCGFKLFRSRVAHDLFSRMRMNGYSFDVEILLMARHHGYRIAEVPVNWTHKPGSKVRLTVDSLQMALDLFRIRARLFGRKPYAPQMLPTQNPQVTSPLV